MPSQADLKVARRYHASLRELFARYAADGANPRALRNLVALCRAASETLTDDYCRSKIRSVEEFGARLFTDGGHDFQRQLALNALELLESRLYSLGLLLQARARELRGGAAQASLPL